MQSDAPARPDGTPAPPSTIGDLAGRLRRQQHGLPLFVALLTLAATFLRFGYVYGSGDQDELIPSLLHLLDGSLFTQDWLVQTVASGVNVRTYFLWLMALPSLVLPGWLSVLLLWIGVTVALSFGVYGLARDLVRDRLAAALSVPVVLVLTVKWTLGANSLAYDALVPEGVAWALAVPAITLFLQRRWGWAGVLLGVAAWFHLLAGAQTALVLGVVGLGRAALSADLEGQKWRADLLDLVRFGGAFVLAALPILVPVGFEQSATSPTVESAPPPFYIHALFRNPHHHLFFSFGAGAHLRFWPVAVFGIAAGRWLHRRGVLRHGGFLAASGVFIALLCGIAVLFVEIVPVTLVAKLQLFKLTVLVTLVASILVTAAFASLLPDALRRFSEGVLGRRWIGLAVATVLLVLLAGLAVRDVGRPGALLHPLRHQASPLGEVEAWARVATAEDALFATPPSVSTFRTFARRAVVADFTGFVFTDAAMQTWFQRLMDIAPITLPATGVGVKPVLDAAYEQLGPADWQRLQSGYGADYALVARGTRLPFAVAFENAEWTVYRLTGPSP
ncbi:MAG: DUF6798 domain-containing protein [Rhodothermales bacterium]